MLLYVMGEGGAATTTTVSQAKKVLVERLIQPLQGQLSVLGSVCWRRFAAQWQAVVQLGSILKRTTVNKLFFFLRSRQPASGA